MENPRFLIQHFLPFLFSYLTNFKIVLRLVIAPVQRGIYLMEGHVDEWVFLDQNLNDESLFLSQSQLKRLAKDNDGIKSVKSFLEKEYSSSAGPGIDLEKQLQAWRENPSWVNQPPEIKVKNYWEILWFHSQEWCQFHPLSRIWCLSQIMVFNIRSVKNMTLSQYYVIHIGNIEEKFCFLLKIIINPMFALHCYHLTFLMALLDILS